MYIEPIKELMSRCSESDRDSLVEQMEKLTAYVNRIIEEAPLLMRAGINLERQDYINYAQQLYASRNKIHDFACDGIAAINDIAKRNHMREIFPNFTLEKANDPTRTVIYNGDTHRKVNEFSAIICNEFYHESSYALEQYLMDNIAKQDLPYQPLSAEDVIKIGEEYETKHSQNNLRDLLDKADKDVLMLTCFDGTSIQISTDPDGLMGYFSRNKHGQIDMADCVVKVKEYNSLTMGDASVYIDRQGIGYEVPVSVLSEFADRHGGIKEYENRDMSQEKDRRRAELKQKGHEAYIKSVSKDLQTLEAGKAMYDNNTRPLQTYIKLISNEINGHDGITTNTAAALEIAMLSDLSEITTEGTKEQVSTFFNIDEKELDTVDLSFAPLWPVDVKYIPQDNHKDILQVKIPGDKSEVSIDINKIMETAREALPEQEAELFAEKTEAFIAQNEILTDSHGEHGRAVRDALDAITLVEAYKTNANPEVLQEGLIHLSKKMNMTALTDIGSIEKIKEEVPWAADRMNDAYLIATITEHMPAIETHLEKIEKLNSHLLEAQASGDVKSVLDNIQKEENNLNKEYFTTMVKELSPAIYEDETTAGSVLKEAMAPLLKTEEQFKTLETQIDIAVQDIKQQDRAGSLIGDE